MQISQLNIRSYAIGPRHLHCNVTPRRRTSSMTPDKKSLEGTNAMNDGLHDLPTSTTRDKIRGVCAYLGSLSRYNTPKKHQPCPVPAGIECSTILRYSRKRKKPESVVQQDVPRKIPCRKLDDQQVLDHKRPKSKVGSDKEPCFCSATITVDGITRQRLLRRKQIGRKSSGKDSAKTNNKIVNVGSQKAPESSGTAGSQLAPRSVILSKDRRNFNSFVRAVVKPAKEPLWCETPRVVRDSKIPKASTPRYNKKVNGSDPSPDSKMARNKIVKVLWHATNYTDPEY